MFYAYPYFNHSFCQLHVETRAFVWKLRRVNLGPAGTLPARFVVADWCGGRLRAMARSGSPLRRLLANFYHAYRGLARKERRKFYAIFRVMNRVEELCAGELPHYDIGDIPAGIRKESKALFLHLFHRLERKLHYEVFFGRLTPSQRYCPFCGLSDLLAPADQTQDYDHCIFKADYPLAAINPKNLAPMCERCNRTYKKDQPLLVDGARARRQAFYPYRDHGVAIGISLDGSRLPSGYPDTGDWHLQITPLRPEVRTWETVFELPNRFVEYEVKPLYEPWLRQFERWALRDYTPNPGPTWTMPDVRTAAESHAAFLNGEPRIPDRVIRPAVFRFLALPQNENFLKRLAESWERKRTQTGLA